MVTTYLPMPRKFSVWEDITFLKVSNIYHEVVGSYGLLFALPWNTQVKNKKIIILHASRYAGIDV